MAANNYILATKVLNNLGNVAAFVSWNTVDSFIKWQHLGMTDGEYKEGDVPVLKIDGEDVVEREEYERHLAEIMR